MFRQPNIPNLRFTIIQAVNPYIQSSSNKFIGKAVSFLPNKKTKVVLNLPKKLLGKNLKLTNQPSTDVVELSSGMRTASVAAKPKNDGKGSCSRLIKNVLNKYFDNDDIGADLMEDKKTTLNQLVEEFGKEQYCKYKAPRKKAMNLMRKDAIAKYKVMQQSIREEENKNRKIFNLYLNQFQDWCDF